MSYSTALTRCRNCRNTKDNKTTLCKNKIYEPLHEVQCSKCNDIWLICVFHKKRFAHRSYFRAKQHLEEFDHSSALKRLTEVSSCGSVDPVLLPKTVFSMTNLSLIVILMKKKWSISPKSIFIKFLRMLMIVIAFSNQIT